MADKLTLPKAKFNHELTPASVDPTMKAAEATTTKLYRVPVSKIKTIPGFNVRVESPDYAEHVDAIRSSIEHNGFDQTKPLAGYVAKEGDENVIYVTDGHTRLAAVLGYNEAAKKDNRIPWLPVLVHSKEVSLTDLTVALHTANSGRPLTPFELGVVVRRLLAEEGAEKKAIAARLGITTRYLDDVLLLANADSSVKQHVVNGSVSSTFAIQALRKDGEKAGEVIAKAVKTATSAGKKATKKHAGPKMQKIKATLQIVEGGDMKDIVKAAAKAIREAVESEAGGDEDQVLAAVEGTISIVVEVPAPEKPAKADKAKKGKKAKDKKAKAEKPAKKSKAKPAEDSEDDIGIEGAEPVSSEGEDDEIVRTPPKVKSDANVPEDDDVDI